MKRIKVIGFILVIFLLSSCGKNQISSTTANNDIKVQLSTDHFIFYCSDKDKKCLKDLSDILNKNYERITKDLDASINGKVKIYLYPDITTYHKETNRPNAPNWSVGSAWNDNTIKMVSPLNSGGAHSYNSMIQAVVHEFTHVVILNIIPNINTIPKWLNEGIAEFEAKQLTEGAKKGLKDELHKNYYPTLDDLDKSPNTFGDKGGYEYSCTIIEYIVKDYGYDKLRALIQSPRNFQGTLGISKDEFQKGWINYLNQNYK